MENYEVYLAGRIANLSYEEAVSSRDEFIHKLSKIDIKCRTPMRGKQHLSKSNNLTAEAFKNGLSVQEVIQRDLSDLDEIDAMILITGDSPSWGSAGEFYYCTWIVKKPTLVIAENYVGGWMEHYATRIVPTCDDAVEVLKHWKKYWNRKGSGIYDTR